MAVKFKVKFSIQKTGSGKTSHSRVVGYDHYGLSISPMLSRGMNSDNHVDVFGNKASHDREVFHDGGSTGTHAQAVASAKRFIQAAYDRQNPVVKADSGTDITKSRNVDILADAIAKALVADRPKGLEHARDNYVRKAMYSGVIALIGKAVDPKDKSTQSMDFDAPAEEPEENRYRMTLRPFGSFNVPNGHKLLNVEPGNGGAGYNHGYFTTDKPLPPEHIRHMDLVHEPTKDAFIYDGQRKLDQHSGHRFTAHARPLDYEGQHQVYDYTTNKDPYHYGIGDYPVHKEDDINHHWNHLMPDTQQNRDAYGADWDKDVRDDIKKAAEYPDITKAHDVSGEARDTVGKWTKGNPLFQKPDQTDTPEFKNWFQDSKVVDAQGKPLVVYHGTQPPGFDTFEHQSRPGIKNLFGPGHYFTDNPDIASQYAESKIVGRTGENGGVYPVHLSIKNPFDVDKDYSNGESIKSVGHKEGDSPVPTLTKDQIEKFSDAAKTADLPLTKFQRQKLVNYTDFKAGSQWEYYMTRSFLNGLRTIKFGGKVDPEVIFQKLVDHAGYDGITHIGGKLLGKDSGIKHQVYIAFHSKQIKSATGNNGDFNPNDPDITKARNIDILADAIMKAMIPSSGSHFDAPLSKAIDPKDKSTLGIDFDTPALPSIPRIPNIHIAIVGSKHKHEVAGVTEFNPETGKTIHGGQFAPSHVPETPVASISMGNEQMDHRVKVLSWNLDKFKNKIEELNRRAAKLKLLPMTYTISPQLKENRASRDGDSVFEFNVHFYNIDIHGETPKLNGWTYVGMVNAKGGVPLIHSAPGQEVPERFRKKIGMCEHCNTNRLRNIMFVVRKGNVTKSIGSDCIKDFLGHGSPESIMAYLDSVADLFNGDDEDDAFGEGSRSHYSFDVPRAVEYAIVSIRKHGYKKSDEDRSTKEDVMDILYPAKDNESTQYSLKMRSDVTDEDREKATNIVNWAQTELRGSEYASNVQKIVEQGTVNEKYLGYIVSLVPVYDREMEKRLKESKSAAGNLGVPGYVGEVGKRQMFTNLTLVKQTQVGDSYSNFGPSNLYIFKDDKNNNFKYFTGKILAIDGLEQARPGFTSPRYLEVGDTVNLEASIKKHEISSYTGENDNVITRAGKITIANPTIENERITARYNSRVQLLEERIKESLSEFVNDGTITQNDADYIYIHGTNDWIKIEGAVEANLSEHQLRYIGRAIGDKINYDHEDLMFELENPPKLISDKKPAKETKVKTVVSKADSSNVKMGTRRVNMENDGVELKHDGKLITVKFDKAPEGSSIASMANAGIVWDEDHGHYTGANTPDALNAAQEAAAHHNAPYGNDTPLTKTLSRDSWSHRGVTFGKVHPGSSKYRMMSMPNDHEFTSHKSACDWIDKQHADAISGLSADKMKRLGLSVDGDNFKSIPGDIIKADDMVSEFTKIVKSVLPTVPCR